MTLRKILGLTCLVSTALCMVIGETKVGRGLTLLAAIFTIVIWLCAYKWSATWLPSVALLVSIGLSAVGLFIGAPPFLMLLGATLDLAIWDLVNFDHVLAGSSPAKTVTLLKKQHYISLGLALGLSLLVIIACKTIRPKILFGGLILLVILAFFSMGRLWHMISD